MRRVVETIATRAPRSRSRRAVAYPMPSGLPAPVTRATLPSRRSVTGASPGSDASTGSSSDEAEAASAGLVRGRRPAAGRVASRRERLPLAERASKTMARSFRVPSARANIAPLWRIPGPRDLAAYSGIGGAMTDPFQPGLPPEPPPPDDPVPPGIPARPGYYYYPPPLVYAYRPRPPTNGLAIASLIVSCAGVLGLCTYGFGAV